MKTENPFLPSVVTGLLVIVLPLILICSCNINDIDNVSPVETPSPGSNDFYWDKVGQLLFKVTFDNDSLYSTRCFIAQGTPGFCAIAIFTAYTFRNEEFLRFKKVEVHNYRNPGEPFWGRVYRNSVNIFNGCVTSAEYEDGKVKFITPTGTVSFHIGTSDYYNLYEKCLAGNEQLIIDNRNQRQKQSMEEGK